MELKRRVFIIGIDGADFDLIMPWVHQGYLPNLHKLLAEGSSGRLRSTIQPTSAPAWVTFMTGVNQGKHGLYDFVCRRSQSYDLQITNASHVKSPTIFDILSQVGGRSIVINLPYMVPPRSVNGIVVGGPFAASVTPDIVYPRSYFETLKRITPDYFILPDYDARASDPMMDYAEKLLKGVALRESLSLNALENELWDLFMVVFMATDEAHHAFWECMEAPPASSLAKYRHVIRDVYIRIDQAIGEMLRRITDDPDPRETVVIVMSDHGAGELRWLINLNSWLAKVGYLAFKNSRLNPLKKLQVTMLKKCMYLYRRYISSETRAKIRDRLGTQHFEQVKEGLESVLLISSVDWSRTQAYALGAGGNIYINLKQREPEGIVQPGSHYEQIRQEIAEALMSLSDPETGERLVQCVYRFEDLYKGPYVSGAPDLVVEWKDYSNWGRGRYDSQGMIFEDRKLADFSERPLTGSHRLHGIFIAQGAAIKSGLAFEGASIHDVVPTILSLMALHPLPFMDGRVLDEILRIPENEYRNQINLAADVELLGELNMTDEEKDKISEHLQSLGYL